MKRNIIVFVAVVLVALFGFSAAAPAKASLPNDGIVDVPVIAYPREGNMIATTATPTIWGLSENDTVVEVALDGIAAGYATTSNGPLFTGTWSLQVPVRLLHGNHTVSATAREIGGTVWGPVATSAMTLYMPAPTPTLKTKTLRVSTTQHPLVVGWTVSGTNIRVSIDGKLDGTQMVPTHPSGTSAFYYRVHESLAKGTHDIAVSSVDTRGNVSVPTHAALTSFVAAAPQKTAAQTPSALAPTPAPVLPALVPTPAPAEVPATVNPTTPVPTPEVMPAPTPALVPTPAPIETAPVVLPAQVPAPALTPKTPQGAPQTPTAPTITVNAPDWQTRLKLLWVSYTPSQQQLLIAAFITIDILVLAVLIVHFRRHWRERKMFMVSERNRVAGSPVSLETTPTLQPTPTVPASLPANDWQDEAGQSQPEIITGPVPGGLPLMRMDPNTPLNLPQQK